MKPERRKTWAADTIRRYMPKREELAANRYLKPFAHRFLSPELWRFTRRSVPRGVALGLFSGFIIPFGQIFLAAFLALPSRANVPLAVAVTFITNPLTFPFWIIVANRVGNTMLDIDALFGGIANEEIESGRLSWLVDLFQAAGVTVFGFLVLAVVSAALGYLVSGTVWRIMVARRRAKRLRLMEVRLDQRLNAK
ncbi:MAG: DUF2062 domain-containing protein [Pseudomonadota bacterium]